MALYKKHFFVLYVVLICFINITHSHAIQILEKTESSHVIDFSKRVSTSQSEVQNEAAPDFAWIIGEAILIIITVVLLLIIYSWHLRNVVSKKTLELKNLNANLEYKVKERTRELIHSREEYKAMYAHAEKERKRAGVALKAERDAINQTLNFIDMISHEYRTPLSVLSSSIEIIQKRSELNQTDYLDDQIKKMNISIKRLIDIFDTSLGKDRTDNLTPHVNIEELSLITIINSSIELTKSAYTNHIIILNDLLDKDHIIFGDKKLLISVFSNILDNACKYSEPTTQVSITICKKQNHIEIITKDTGVGIDEDEQQLVFEKYFRSERTGVKQGVGVGLFLVKSIVGLHSGEVKLKSVRNVGTEISVILPRKEKV